MNLEFKSGRTIAGAVPLIDRRLIARTETILLIEEQRVIRQHLAGCLESLGYKVLALPDAGAAPLTLFSVPSELNVAVPVAMGLALDRFVAAPA